MLLVYAASARVCVCYYSVYILLRSQCGGRRQHWRWRKEAALEAVEGGITGGGGRRQHWRWQKEAALEVAEGGSTGGSGRRQLWRSSMD
jgi:hypothetical protein